MATAWRKSSYSMSNGECVEIAVLSLDCWNRDHTACTDLGCGCGCGHPGRET